MRSAPADRLAEVLTDPAWAVTIEPEVIPALLTAIASLQARLAARLLEVAPTEAVPHAETGELLRIDEAARRLSVSKTWLYRRVDRLPFVVRLDRGVRVSAAGLERYLRTHRARRFTA